VRNALLAAIALAALSTAASANDQVYLDECIASWGRSSPFAKGTPANNVMSTGVKVFGVGNSNSGNDPVTKGPSLVMVHPAVNVMGKSTIRLANPNGWYCFRSNVTVAGKMVINAHCNAHIASGKEGGTTVGGADDSNKGVAVLGALRVTRFGCPAKS
jgi:hypothetical protein